MGVRTIFLSLEEKVTINSRTPRASSRRSVSVVCDVTGAVDERAQTAENEKMCGEMLFFHACTMSKSLSSHSANAQKGVGEPWFLVISSSSTSQKHNISTLSGHIEFASGELSFFPFKRYHAKQRDATRKLGKVEVRGRTERTADLENPLTNER